MKLPFLQVADDAFERAAELAALLGIPEPQALGHLVYLWRWAISRENMTGVVQGRIEAAIAIVEAGARWKGTRGALLEALDDLHLAEVLPDGVRVCGMDRYQRAVEKQQANRARWQRHNEKHRAVTASQPRGQTPKDGDGDGDGDGEVTTYVRAPEDTVRPAGLSRIEAPDTPPEGWSGDDFWRWFQSLRQVQEKPPHPAKLAAWWTEARGATTVEALMEGAVEGYCRDPYWRKASPPVPFRGYMAQWQRFAPARGAA